MHRRQQEAGFKSGRSGHGRKEWDQSSDDQHQMEAREHARLPAKSLKTHHAREAEAQRQIRDLRSRY
jgi:hypothetical protein